MSSRVFAKLFQRNFAIHEKLDPGNIQKKAKKTSSVALLLHSLVKTMYMYMYIVHYSRTGVKCVAYILQSQKIFQFETYNFYPTTYTCTCNYIHVYMLRENLE